MIFLSHEWDYHHVNRARTGLPALENSPAARPAPGAAPSVEAGFGPGVAGDRAAKRPGILDAWLYEKASPARTRNHRRLAQAPEGGRGALSGLGD